MYEFDPLDLEAQSARREELRRTQAAAAQQFREDFQWLMGSERGRRVVHWLLSASGVFRSTWVQPKEAGAYMALAMAHAEGTKELGYRLLATINTACPNQYAKMMKENS